MEELTNLVGLLNGGQTTVKAVEKPIEVNQPKNVELKSVCALCGSLFKSQNSVNAHMKYCPKNPKATFNKKPKEVKVVEKPVEVEEVKAEPKLVPKEEPETAKTEATKARRSIEIPAHKKKVEVKPSFVKPSKDALRKAVFTHVLNNKDTISSTPNIVHELRVALEKEQGKSIQLTQYIEQVAQIEVANILKALEVNLGASNCMGMHLAGGGYQLAVFAESGNLTLQKLVDNY